MNENKDYLRVLSHQLKSPINAIESLLKTVTDGYTGDVNNQTKQVLAKAINRVDEARDLVSDLLDFQRYSQGESLEREPFNLNNLLRELRGAYTSSAAEKDVSLHMDLPSSSSVVINGDKRGMNQAIRNLVENALKYTPARGSVTLRLKVSADEKECRLQVIDTGYGIPEDEVESIFKPFYRSSRHKSNISGTGLGLSIVKQIVEIHDGTVSVSSRQQSGTTFEVTLPVHALLKSDQPAVQRKQVLIVGGVTAGPKTAARLRRLDEDLDITIIEKNQFLSYAGCGLPAYINGTVESSKELMTTADATVRDIDFFESIENITILNDTVADEIDRNRRVLNVRDRESGTSSELHYDFLVLATGAKPHLPDVPGIEGKGVYTLNSLENAETIKALISRREAQEVCIIGGGLVGISTAESLITTGKRVTLLEKQTHILSNLMDWDMAVKLENELKQKGLKIVTGTTIEKVDRPDGTLSLMTDKGGYPADVIIVAAGVTPNTELAEKADLEIGLSGGIKVNTHLQTTDENIYAIGDCAESINLITQKHDYWPLGSISTKMGRVAADNIAGIKSEFYGSLGTALFKIVDINVARTGLTERDAWYNGFKTESAVTVGLDRAHYVAASENVIIKVVAEKKTQRILGAQMFGKGDVAGRIGIFAEAISSELTLEDFFKLDLGYSPVFNNPIDIVQTGCLVLKNKMEKLVRTISADEFNRQREELDGIISVCPLSVYPRYAVPDSISIPLENLRSSSIPFPQDARIVLYSRTSSGAYIAYRYLLSQGYNHLLVLEGGYEFWSR